MAKSVIYTRTGDDGTTSLVGGERVPKSHQRLECYGTIDELNSFIGLLMCEDLPQEDSDFLRLIQHKLFTVGSYLATDQGHTTLMVESRIHPKTIERVEKEIDRLEELVPPMKAFILPGGSRTSSLAHVCRTVCRRAERQIFRLGEDVLVEEPVMRHVNRLSDYFFALARKEVWRTTGGEIIWDKSFD